MVQHTFFVDSDINKAETLPSAFYDSDVVFERLRTAVFKNAWHWIGPDIEGPKQPQDNVFPLTLMQGFLDEPLLLVRQNDATVACLSNVCTHRGNLLVDAPCKLRQLVCGYHGRQFNIDGSFKSMPEFEGVTDFPRPCDDLKKHPLLNWGGHRFVGINPSFMLNSLFRILDERVGFLPVHAFTHQPGPEQRYSVDAHWALYCDNYLEGFHIPFVHASLNTEVDYDAYETVLFDSGNLQIAYARNDASIFDLPGNHVDFGKKISAYYFWLFPNLMLNFYPWGLSVNVVEPVSKTKSNVLFKSYIYDQSKMHQGAGADLDLVEKEDEDIVASVQKGIQSTGYTTGRFSPSREKGVHQFHCMLSKILSESELVQNH